MKPPGEVTGAHFAGSLMCLLGSSIGGLSYLFLRPCLMNPLGSPVTRCNHYQENSRRAPCCPCPASMPLTTSEITCFLASMSQLELWFFMSLSKTQCQVHLRYFNNRLSMAASRQCVFAVITQPQKEEHKRLVDFGWAQTPER